MHVAQTAVLNPSRWQRWQWCWLAPWPRLLLTCPSCCTETQTDPFGRAIPPVLVISGHLLASAKTCSRRVQWFCPPRCGCRCDRPRCVGCIRERLHRIFYHLWNWCRWWWSAVLHRSLGSENSLSRTRNADMTCVSLCWMLHKPAAIFIAIQLCMHPKTL